MANNPLYENIKINHHSLKILKGKFISFNIIENMIYCSFDQHKYKNYVINFYNNNFENNLNAAIANISIEGDHINKSFIYNNIDNKK